MDILEEARSLVDGERQSAYGSPTQNIKDIAELWSVWFGREVTPRDVAMAMVLVKISREKNLHKKDNLVDLAGYAYIYNDKLGDEK